MNKKTVCILTAAISGVFLTVSSRAEEPRSGSVARPAEKLDELGSRLKALHEYRESVRARFGADREGRLDPRGARAFERAVREGSFQAPPEGPALAPDLAKKYGANSDGSLTADGRLALTIDALRDRTPGVADDAERRDQHRANTDEGHPTRPESSGRPADGERPFGPRDFHGGAGRDRDRDRSGGSSPNPFGGRQRQPEADSSEARPEPRGDRNSPDGPPSHRESLQGAGSPRGISAQDGPRRPWNDRAEGREGRRGEGRGGSGFSPRGFASNEPQRPEWNRRPDERGRRPDRGGFADRDQAFRGQRFNPRQFADNESQRRQWGHRSNERNGRQDRDGFASRGQAFHGQRGNPPQFAYNDRQHSQWDRRSNGRGDRSFRGGFAGRDQAFRGQRGNPRQFAFNYRQHSQWGRGSNARGGRSFRSGFANRSPQIRGRNFDNSPRFGEGRAGMRRNPFGGSNWRNDTRATRGGFGDRRRAHFNERFGPPRGFAPFRQSSWRNRSEAPVRRGFSPDSWSAPRGERPRSPRNQVE